VALGARGARRLEPAGRPRFAHDHADDRGPDHHHEHDDDNYLKFDLEATSPTNIQFSTSLEDTLNGVQVNQTLNTLDANSILPANNAVWLRMSKQGARYSTSYSVDGETWVPVWTTGATLTNPQVGVVAFNRAGTTADLGVSFDYFHVTASRP